MGFTSDNNPSRKGIQRFKLPPLDDIKDRIREAVKNQGNYTPDLEMMIDTAAAAYSTMLLAGHDIRKLTKTYYQTRSREGNIEYKPHPAIRNMRESQQMAVAALRALGLTVKELATTDADPFDDFVKKVGRA